MRSRMLDILRFEKDIFRESFFPALLRVMKAESKSGFIGPKMSESFVTLPNDSIL